MERRQTGRAVMVTAVDGTVKVTVTAMAMTRATER
jgi:hypothetical protein